VLRWLTTVVVSDTEKGARDASGGDHEDGAQSRRRDRCWSVVIWWGDTRTRAYTERFGMSLAGARVSARWCPAC